MRRDRPEPCRSVAAPAVWWTLAVVHMLPLARLLATGEGDVAAVAVLFALVGFCVAVGSWARRTDRSSRRRVAIGFLLATAVAHPEATGNLLVAEPLPAVAATAVVSTLGATIARRSGRRELRQRLRAFASGLAAALGTWLDDLERVGVQAPRAIGVPAPPMPGRLRARGPPA